MPDVKFAYVNSLPETLVPGTIYFDTSSHTIKVAMSNTEMNSFGDRCDASEVTMNSYETSTEGDAISTSDTADVAISKLEATFNSLNTRLNNLD